MNQHIFEAAYVAVILAWPVLLHLAITNACAWNEQRG